MSFVSRAASQGCLSLVPPPRCAAQGAEAPLPVSDLLGHGDALLLRESRNAVAGKVVARVAAYEHVVSENLRCVAKLQYGAVRRTLGLSKAPWLIPDIAIIVDSFLQLNAARARQLLFQDIYAHSFSRASMSVLDTDSSMPGLVDASFPDTDSSILDSDDDDTSSRVLHLQTQDGLADVRWHGFELPAHFPVTADREESIWDKCTLL